MPDYYVEERQTYNLGRVNGRGTVHAAFKKMVSATGKRPWPHFTNCGIASSGLVKTARAVTCKRCLAKEPTS